MTPRTFPTIQDNYKTYELMEVPEDSLFDRHFTAYGQILINPKDYLTITLSGLREYVDEWNYVTLVHPRLLWTQPDRFGNQVISIPINTKLDVVIHVTQVIDEDFISNANYDVQWQIRHKSGWLACSSYEVIVKSCENNSDPVETTILWEGVTLHVL